MHKRTKRKLWSWLTWLLIIGNLYFNLVIINRKNDTIAVYHSIYCKQTEIMELYKERIHSDSLKFDNYRKAFKMLNGAFEERPRYIINKYYINQK